MMEVGEPDADGVEEELDEDADWEGDETADLKKEREDWVEDQEAKRVKERNTDG